MRAWFESNENSATLDKFLKKAKYLTGVYCLKADAKRELLIITMQYSEIVSEYYQCIFKLWQNAETPADERIEKFICTLRQLISNLLLGRKYTNIKILLDKAKSIEEIKKNIIDNFPKQKKPFTSKFNSQGSSKKFGTGSGSATPARRSATLTRRFAKGLAGTGTSSLGDCTYSNLRFGSASKKLEGWVGLWHKLQAFPKKLTNDKQIIMARERHYCSCCGSRHKISNNCCLSKTKTFNAAKVKEVENSRSEEEENA